MDKITIGVIALSKRDFDSWYGYHVVGEKNFICFVPVTDLFDLRGLVFDCVICTDQAFRMADYRELCNTALTRIK